MHTTIYFACCILSLEATLYAPDQNPNRPGQQIFPQRQPQQLQSLPYHAQFLLPWYIRYRTPSSQYPLSGIAPFDDIQTSGLPSTNQIKPYKDIPSSNINAQAQSSVSSHSSIVINYNNVPVDSSATNSSESTAMALPPIPTSIVLNTYLVAVMDRIQGSYLRETNLKVQGMISRFFVTRVNDAAKTTTTSITLSYTFVNNNLTWNPDLFAGIKWTDLPNSKLFLPELGSCFSDALSVRGPTTSHVDYLGTVKVTMVLTITAPCSEMRRCCESEWRVDKEDHYPHKLTFQLFPFDIQRCSSCIHLEKLYGSFEIDFCSTKNTTIVISAPAEFLLWSNFSSETRSESINDNVQQRAIISFSYSRFPEYYNKVFVNLCYFTGFLSIILQRLTSDINAPIGSLLGMGSFIFAFMFDKVAKGQEIPILYEALLITIYIGMLNTLLIRAAKGLEEAWTRMGQQEKEEEEKKDKQRKLMRDKLNEQFLRRIAWRVDLLEDFTANFGAPAKVVPIIRRRRPVPLLESIDDIPQSRVVKRRCCCGCCNCCSCICGCICTVLCFLYRLFIAFLCFVFRPTSLATIGSCCALYFTMDQYYYFYMREWERNIAELQSAVA